MANAAEELSTDQLEKSLGALVNAASQMQNLTKGDGVQIANSGTTSDGKPAGGGQGSMSDAGGLDDLMIGKMSAAGIDAGTIAAFSAFMSSQNDEDDDEEDDDEEDEMSGKMGDVPMPPFQGKGNGGKVPVKRPAPGNAQKSDGRTSLAKSSKGSLAKSISDDPQVAKAVDVSPYLDALTARVTGAIDSLEKSQATFAASQGNVNVGMANALHQIGKLVKSQAAVIEELGKRLNIVERAPVAAPKGKTHARALEKSMPGEAGAAEMQLKKSEVLSTLSYMNLEKGVRDINGVRTSEIIGRYEAGDVIDPGTLHAVASFLKSNPNEADAARRYA